MIQNYWDSLKLAQNYSRSYKCYFKNKCFLSKECWFVAVLRFWGLLNDQLMSQIEKQLICAGFSAILDLKSFVLLILRLHDRYSSFIGFLQQYAFANNNCLTSKMHLALRLIEKASLSCSAWWAFQRSKLIKMSVVKLQIYTFTKRLWTKCSKFHLNYLLIFWLKTHIVLKLDLYLDTNLTSF